jgi:hypothetical protein
MNDENLKRALPDGIEFDTCSGFANFGDLGRRLGDIVAEKGKNEYVSAGRVNGVARKWLCHFQTTKPERVQEAKRVFSSMRSGVYGSVNHSSPREQTAFFMWLEFLHSQDPDGRMCRTVSQVIEEKLLPEKAISDDVLNVGRRQSANSDLRREIRRTVRILRRLLAERRAEGVDVTDAERLDRQSREAMQRGQLDECLRLLRKAIRAAGEGK